jgi:hypothetical protein
MAKGLSQLRDLRDRHPRCAAGCHRVGKTMGLPAIVAELHRITRSRSATTSAAFSTLTLLLEARAPDARAAVLRPEPDFRSMTAIRPFLPFGQPRLSVAVARRRSETRQQPPFASPQLRDDSENRATPPPAAHSATPAKPGGSLRLMPDAPEISGALR